MNYGDTTYYSSVPVPGASRYRITETGELWQIKSGKQLGVKPNRDGYHYTTITLDNGGQRNMAVHTLVAETFIGVKPGDDYTVDHLDGDASNNAVENLEWVTRGENARRRWARARGDLNGAQGLTDEWWAEYSDILAEEQLLIMSDEDYHSGLDEVA